MSRGDATKPSVSADIFIQFLYWRSGPAIRILSQALLRVSGREDNQQIQFPRPASSECQFTPPGRLEVSQHRSGLLIEGKQRPGQSEPYRDHKRGRHDARGAPRLPDEG